VPMGPRVAGPMLQAVRDTLIVFMAATAQAHAEATKAAQRAGIEHAKQNDERAYLAGSGATRAISSIRCATCWGRKR
jgi:DNA invertase Pin-like site-specific DNA recombinase